MANGEKDATLDELAADYVLGVLDPAQRAELERRVKSDEALAMAVGAWQMRLEPLLETIAPVTPPQGNIDAVWKAIEEREGRAKQRSLERGAATGIERDGGQVILLQRRVRIWRRAALAAGALAAALLFYVAVNPLAQNPIIQPSASFVAVLQSNDKTAHFIASVDLEQGRMHLLRVGPAPQAGRAFELWAIGGPDARPRSVGLISSGGALPLRLFQNRNKADLQKTTLAVSLEPAGGSPSGQPTGPVLFTGKLVPLADK